MDLPALLTSWFGLDSPEMQRAGIAAIFGTAGVLVTGFIALLTWLGSQWMQRRRDRAARREKVADIETALLAEIRSYRHGYAGVDWSEYLSDVTSRMRSSAAGSSFVPFVPKEPESQLWASVAREVHVLPIEVIDPIVLFFSQLETLRGLSEDLRGDRYWSLDTSRQVAMYEDYIARRRYSVQLAQEAQEALVIALNLPLSSWVQGGSAPKSASAGSGASDAEKS